MSFVLANVETDQQMFISIDDGSGASIPNMYNPLVLLERIPNPEDQRRFSLDALSYYEFFGYDTPMARLHIQQAFNKYQSFNQNQR